MTQEREKFNKVISDSLVEGTFLKLIFSKPKLQAKTIGNSLKSIKYELVELKSKVKIKETGTTKTQTLTKIHDLGENVKLLWNKCLNEDFYFADLITKSADVSFKSNSKASEKVIIKTKLNILPDDVQSVIIKHDRKKKYLIDEGSPFLQKLNITSENGRVHADAHKKFRQINKFVEIVSNTIDNTTSEIKIVDMGSGKSYLTFALYDYFTNSKVKATVTGYELRPDLVLHCNEIATELGFTTLTLIESDIANADIGKTDVLIALHACDIATDLAIKKGLDAEAKYMFLSPCCHKQVRKAMSKKDNITKHGIFEERQAEMITDSIRALILEHYGYSTSIIEFISQEHTTKNTMIIAKKTGVINRSALNNIQQIKDQYGIEYQYLELLCGI